MRHIRKIVYIFPGIFLVPLVYNNVESGWSVYENTYAFYLFSSFILLVSILSLLAVRTQAGLSFSRIDILLFLFASFIFLLVLIEQQSSFSDEKVITGLYLLLLFPYFKIVFSTREGTKILQVVIIFTGLISSLHGLAQFFHLLPSPNGAFLVTGSFNNPGPYSGYLAATIAFAIINLKRESKPLRVLSIATICCIALVLIITQSRSAWIAVVVSLVFLLQAQFGILKKIKHSWIIPLVFFFLLTIAMIPLKSDSASGRVLIWKVSYEMFKDSPLMGLGPGQFACQYNNYQSAYFKNNPGDKLYSSLADNNYFAFNEGIQISVESGLIGLLLCSSILFLAFKDASNENANSFVLAAKATLLTICVFGLFSYPFSSLAISVILVACLACLSLHSQNQRTLMVNPLTFKIMVGLALIVISGITYKVFEQYAAIKQWKEIHTYLTTEEEPGAIEDYKSVYPVLRNHGGFLFNYGAELSEAGFYKESIDVLEKAKLKFNHVDLYIFLGNSYKGLKQYDKAEAAYLHASYMIPNRLFTKYLLVQLYVERNKMKEALTLAKHLVAMTPKVNSSTVSAIKNEMTELLRKNQSQQSE